MRDQSASRTAGFLGGRFTIRQLAALTLVSATLTGLILPETGRADKPKPLSERDVLELLHDVPSTRIGDLARERGIDFEVTFDISKKFREAGATQELIETLEEVGKRAREETKPQTGSIKVKTEPGDAQVYLSDEFKGMTSPEGDLRMPNIAPANYRLRVSKEGYQTWEYQIMVSQVRLRQCL